jgi:hypothetical protein
MVNRGLCGSVDGTFFEGYFSEVRPDVNDPATSLGQHDACCRLRCEEDTFYGCIKGLVVLFFRYIERIPGTCPAGIVDEDIDTAEFRYGLLHQGPTVLDFIYIGRNDQSLSSKIFDLLLQFFDLFRSGAWIFCQYEMSACLRKPYSDSSANALRGTSNDRNLPFEAKAGIVRQEITST